jgi:hypothetical protein
MSVGALVDTVGFAEGELEGSNVGSAEGRYVGSFEGRKDGF